MNNSQQIRARIEFLDSRGWGVVSTPTGRVHVPGTLVGEMIRCRRVGDQPWLRHKAILLAIEKSSPRRVNPCCSQDSWCPGCTLRHLSAADQLEYKRHKLLRILAHHRLNLPENIAFLPAASNAAYRSRTTLNVITDRYGTRPAMAPLPGYSRSVDLSLCPVQHERLNCTIRQLTDSLPQPLLLLLSQIRVQLGQGSTTRIVLVYQDRNREPEVERLVMMSRWGKEQQICIAPTGTHTQKAVLAQARVLLGQDRFTIRLLGRSLLASPVSWTPVSPVLLQPLSDLLLAAVKPTPSTSILELGCGIGVMSFFLASHSRSLFGVDQTRTAVMDAQNNAETGTFSHLRFRHGRAAHMVRRLAKKGESFDVAVFHGMRRPYKIESFQILGALGIRRVVLFSASPAALAADLATLQSLNWHVDFLRAYDSLPHTAHFMVAAAAVPS